MPDPIIQQEPRGAAPRFSYPLGRILLGVTDSVRRAYEKFAVQPIDFLGLCEGPDAGYSPKRTTLGGDQSVTGPGTFYGRAQRTLTFKPSDEPGWWINRFDLTEQLKTRVSIRNVWTSARNIVLRSGNPHNYLRMVEHIIALRLGMGVDDLVIDVNSGDPPLFDRSSLDLVEAIEAAKIVERDEPARYVTVKEPVTFGNDGSFLTFLPPERGERKLRIDCAIDFASVIGQQRIVFDLTPALFKQGAYARTNATRAQMILANTVGFLFADLRNIGYTRDNILIHGKDKFYGEPRFVQPGGKALEPVWHRATLDLLAALALIDEGRFVGRVVSYRAGHTLDVRAVIQLYRQNLLTFL